MTSPEFALAVDACRAEIGNRVTRDGRTQIDWPRFIALCRRHRIQGLVQSGLSRLGIAPPPIEQAALAADANQIVAQNLVSSLESGRILQGFEAASIPILFVKGLTLATLAYPNPFLKMGWDIDILVPPDRVDKAMLALRELGYSPVIPTGDVARWHRRQKESTWSTGTSFVELHTRLADSPALIPGIDALSPRQMVKLPGGIALPTLADDHLFAYLAVHGAWSAWYRLKWLADFAAFLRGRSEQEIDLLYERSLALAAGRCPAQALMLAHRHFGTPLSPALQAQLSNDNRLPLLLRLAERQMSGRKEIGEPTAMRLGTASIHLSELFLVQGTRFKIEEVLRKISDKVSAAGFA